MSSSIACIGFTEKCRGGVLERKFVKLGGKENVNGDGRREKE